MRTLASSHVARTKRRRTRPVNDRTVLLTMVAITVLIVGLLVLAQILATRTSEPIAATPVDAALLPLAAPVNPVVGGHNMDNLPDPGRRGTAVGAETPQANVDLPLTRWDWGTIPAIPAVEQTFPIQNTGDEPLLITNVGTSCGCTTAALSSSVIPPGQRADLRVVFDPNFHATSGPVTRLVWLETNDPDLPVVELRLDANVVP